MVSGSGIDRDRLTGNRRVGVPGLVLALGLLLLAPVAVWFFGFRGSEDGGAVVADTTTSSSITAATATTLAGDLTPTSGPVATTEVVVDVASVPVLTEDQAYLDDQPRLVWLPGIQTGWLVDLETGTVGSLPDIPAPRGGGVPVRDGSLVAEIGGRVLRLAPDGEWTDLSPAGDRTYRIIETRTGRDHLHIYLIESGGVTDRLLNVMYRYEATELLEEKWVADGTDIVRVSASLATQLVMVELAPLDAEGAPRYLLLSEESGRPTSRKAFPSSDPGSSYVWGVELAPSSEVFYMRCEASSYAECGVSDGFISDLGSGAVSPVGEIYPGWSREWENPDRLPSFTHAYGDRALLVRTNVDWANLQSGERDRLISARDL